MIKVRLARQGDINRQKEIWGSCFGDDPDYIDFYFGNRYKSGETLLLLCNDLIVSMLTMITVRVVMPDGRDHSAVMLYAIATHPGYQGRGFASRIMDFCDRYLADNHKEMSVLVPASNGLFGFYRKRGYTSGFSIREIVLAGESIEGFKKLEYRPFRIAPATPRAYNHRRNSRLQGRLHVAYDQEEIAYQKKLSNRSGADIYAIDMDGVRGCAAMERINPGRVFIKELLMPQHLVPGALAQIIRLLPAKEYILRLPADIPGGLGGNVRHFGMFKPYSQLHAGMLFEEDGYLGIAFD